jgi:hypothetical protein
MVAVAGSIDGSVEASVSAGDAVLESTDHEPATSVDVVGATEKVESWDLSEAVAKTAGENIQVRRFVRFNLGEGL